MAIFKQLVSQTESDITGATNSTTVDLINVDKFSVQLNIDVDTPADDTFTDSDVEVTPNTVVIDGHGLPTGLKCQLTTTGTLPAGLALTTDYFIIAVDEDTISFATTLANAQAGVEVDITAAEGGGTHTIDITALAGATVKMQKSNDGVNWVDWASATNITTDAVVMFEEDSCVYRYARLQYAITAGSMSNVHKWYLLENK